MPWYWSDDLVRTLVSKGALESETAALSFAQPVAFRRDESTIEEAAEGLLDDGEIPLAA